MLDAVHTALEKDRIRRRHEADLMLLQQRANTLTPREQEILPLVVAGLLNKQVAERIGASEATVKVLRSQLTRKMGARSLVDLVRIADKLGIDSASSDQM
ncbi:MAG TPA: LuxR C-terminal-related transcriptional regulator [Terriglobales bacterium]|nr:LuxR C-terminal-related transcriptional regulator [Terriglobales bacterium]